MTSQLKLRKKRQILLACSKQLQDNVDKEPHNESELKVRRQSADGRNQSTTASGVIPLSSSKYGRSLLENRPYMRKVLQMRISRLKYFGDNGPFLRR